MTNKELTTYIKLLQKGDMSSFDPIYHETKKLVFYTVLSILKDESISEDIMQETYLKMLEKIHSFKKSVSVKSWITTIARNLALNEYKKRKRELQVDITESEYLFGSTESNSEKELIIRDILGNLKETERDIVIYHVVSDLTFKEISKILDIPIGTVTWKYSEALKKLRSLEESR
jgi:RNA polymerase sigma-70 factor (ECF subfamily)